MWARSTVLYAHINFITNNAGATLNNMNWRLDTALVKKWGATNLLGAQNYLKLFQDNGDDECDGNKNEDSPITPEINIPSKFSMLRMYMNYK